MGGGRSRAAAAFVALRRLGWPSEMRLTARKQAFEKTPARSRVSVRPPLCLGWAAMGSCPGFALPIAKAQRRIGAAQIIPSRSASRRLAC
jgi:hypothetical protein